MRVLSLFAGVGGFDLGLERAGMRTVAFCERDEFCRRVLAKHWPSVPCFDDVRTLKGEDVGAVDVICGGYPCQPFSTAGVQLGEADDRYLWPEFARLIAEIRPAWVIGENVAGHIALGLDTVLSDLEALGYTARPFVIPAVGVGAEHKRDRVWIVGHADRQLNTTVRGECQGASPQGDSGRAERIRRNGDARREIPIRITGEDTSPTADAASIGRQGRGRAKHAVNCTQEGEGEADQPFNAMGRITESPVRRADDGLPRGLDRARLKALGNAVHPEIPYRIGRAILQAEGRA